MASVYPPALPHLPLLLWDTPPALEQMLAQEGIPFRRVQDPHPLAFGAGRFVLYDSRQVASSQVRAVITPLHTALDVNVIRREWQSDPFEEWLSTRATLASWSVAGVTVSERVSRVDRSRMRRKVVQRLKTAVTRAGGCWARLSPYPFPYHSAFNLRIDLDEPAPLDYARMARARRPLEDCVTHFVSTQAYGKQPGVLADLRRFDTQSHGHYHVVYRDQAANERNLERAQAALLEKGFTPVAFAAPEGRWNVGLNAVLERLGYAYSSEFQVGYDELPFSPWLGDRFSRVLQVPVHPICEGLFLNAGVTSGQEIADYMAAVIRAKVHAGEPAFVYGHPEGRLGRYPEILTGLAAEVARHALIWRVTLTEFARWWRWRETRRWSIVPRDENRLEVQFDDWDSTYPLGLEIQRGLHRALVPVPGSRFLLNVSELAYEPRNLRFDLPAPTPMHRPHGWKAAVRTALDWETVTPLADLHVNSWRGLLKKGLRRWRAANPPASAAETRDHEMPSHLEKSA